MRHHDKQVSTGVLNAEMSALGFYNPTSFEQCWTSTIPIRMHVSRFIFASPGDA